MTQLSELKVAVESALAAHLDISSPIARPLVEAMRYATLGGGKRLRPLFVCASATGLGGPLDAAIHAGCAVEFIHNYSLVHDDLPAMDDDDLRHGRAATHIAHGEATAILAGDALLTAAFSLLAETPSASAEQRLQMVHTLADASGWRGMVGGQTFDMQLAGSRTEPASLSQLQSMHAAKSGALIRASVELGAILANASEEQLVILREFSDRVGLAFQITDDVLDVTASSEELGKPAGSDEQEDKHTFVRLMGVEQARKQADKLLNEAQQFLRRLPLQNELLGELAEMAVRRSF